MESRSKSLLTAAGDTAKWIYERGVLLAALEHTNWNLTHTAALLGFSAPTQTLHAIDRLGLRDQYDIARRAHKRY